MCFHAACSRERRRVPDETCPLSKPDLCRLPRNVCNRKCNACRRSPPRRPGDWVWRAMRIPGTQYYFLLFRGRPGPLERLWVAYTLGYSGHTILFSPLPWVAGAAGEAMGGIHLIPPAVSALAPSWGTLSIIIPQRGLCQHQVLDVEGESVRGAVSPDGAPDSSPGAQALGRRAPETTIR